MLIMFEVGDPLHVCIISNSVFLLVAIFRLFAYSLKSLNCDISIHDTALLLS